MDGFSYFMVVYFTLCVNDVVTELVLLYDYYGPNHSPVSPLLPTSCSDGEEDRKLYVRA